MSVSAETRPKDESPLRGAIGAGLASTLLFSAPRLAGPLGLLAVLAPVPLSVARLRGGLLGGLGAVGVGAVAQLLVASPWAALTFALAVALPAIALGETVDRGRGLVGGSVVAFAVVAAEVLAVFVAIGPQMGAWATEPFDLSRSPEVLAQMKASGMAEEQVEALVEQIGVLRAIVAVVFPALYLIGAGVAVLANTAALRIYLARRYPDRIERGELEALRWPVALSIPFVLAGAGVAVPVLRPASYNVLLVLAFLFALEGLAIVAYYAARLAAPPVIRGALVVLVLVNPWAAQTLALLGLADLWIDLRRWARPKEVDSG
jgi:uncharacterized protein YybS (DUF2232 family)